MRSSVAWVTVVAGLATAGLVACEKKARDGAGAPGASGVAAARRDLYRCSMHPQITSDRPGQCPICHMDLQKVEDDAPGPQVAMPAGAGSATEGRAAFTLSQERQQLIGLTTAKAEVVPLVHEIRASGRVAFDPELFTAVEEYRQALLSRGQMDEGPLKAQARELLSSARTKLRLMGLSDEQIRGLSSGASSSMSLLLPKGAVWVYAEVFEYEVAGLRSGLTLEVEAPSVPGKRFQGKVSSISPIVNSPTRTVRVRALVPDKEGLLRPDTFVNVKILIDLGDRLAVPESAVMHSGDQSFVFVVKDQGRFEPRAIRVGSKTKDYYEVVDGLKDGELVVTAANFLIDSESRLRGVLPAAKPHAHPEGK